MCILPVLFLSITALALALQKEQPEQPLWNAQVSYSVVEEGHMGRLNAEYQIDSLGRLMKGVVRYSDEGRGWNVSHAIFFSSHEEWLSFAKGGKALGDGGFLESFGLPTIFLNTVRGRRFYVLVSGDRPDLDVTVFYPKRIRTEVGYDDLRVNYDTGDAPVEFTETPTELSEEQAMARAMEMMKSPDVQKEIEKELVAGMEREGKELQGNVVQGSLDWGTPDRKRKNSLSWSFSLISKDELAIKIVNPSPDSEHVFQDKKLVITAEAEVEPAKYEKEVIWEVQDIRGSRKRINPQKGKRVTITFDVLPGKNDQFGLKKITAKVRGKQDQVTVKVFFAKDGRDNPEEKYPNWFYYWRQGVVTDLDRFQYERGGSQYDPKTGKLVISDEAPVSLPGGPVGLKKEITKPDGKKCKVQGVINIVQTEGVDSVARVVVHELEHERLYKMTGGKMTGDQDQDGVPDAVELGELGSLFCLDPRNNNTLELKKSKDGASGDDELLAIFAEAKESESKSRVNHDKDWASPGSQSKTGK